MWIRKDIDSQQHTIGLLHQQHGFEIFRMHCLSKHYAIHHQPSETHECERNQRQSCFASQGSEHCDASLGFALRNESELVVLNYITRIIEDSTTPSQYHQILQVSTS